NSLLKQTKECASNQIVSRFPFFEAETSKTKPVRFDATLSKLFYARFLPRASVVTRLKKLAKIQYIDVIVFL
ncbi:MAG: hypothetical protein KAI83_07375, partial [Thiomargarita sp.]|nr:hypothetical protein [Thiomargarita sp.]